MTVDEYRPLFYRPVATVSQITEFYDIQDFVARNVGIKTYHKFEDEDAGVPMSWRLKISQSLALLEPQIEGSIYYHYSEQESYFDIGERDTNAYGTFSPDREWDWIWSVGKIATTDGKVF